MLGISDNDAVLSVNKEWNKLDEVWGPPIDLETTVEDKPPPSKMKAVFSSLDLRHSTFDSSYLFTKVAKEFTDNYDPLDYDEFIEDLEVNAVKDVPEKLFYFVNGQILSAVSVDDICDKINDIFKSVDKLSSATSTICHRRNFNRVVNHTFSTNELSFDDTKEEKEKSDMDDIDRYIDEAFHQLSVTITSLAEEVDEAKELPEASVTTLVKRFSSILSNPGIKKSPRRMRECCDRFRELVAFWTGRASIAKI